jgi:hypothetical protein
MSCDRSSTRYPCGLEVASTYESYRSTLILGYTCCAKRENGLRSLTFFNSIKYLAFSEM